MEKINIEALEYLHIKDVMDKFTSKVESASSKTSSLNGRWVITEGFKPATLYAYLNARFGRANGIQMLFKEDSSDNFIHWHYSLQYGEHTIEIMCMSYRMEILHGEQFIDSDKARELFITDIKSDYKNYGKKMSEFKKTLEKWHLFINPFFRLKSVIEHQLVKLESLEIDKLSPLVHPTDSDGSEEFGKKVNNDASSYIEATALGLNIRMLAPVYAESFINLLIFLLADNEIKNDKRLYESFTRQQIDIRIKNLHRNCNGFHQAVDFDNVESCRKFFSVMNNRNDLLHGNIDPQKQMYDTVFFEDKIPLFNEFGNFFRYSLEASINNVTPELAINDYQAVQDFIAYVLICLKDDTREHVRIIMDKRSLGWNDLTKRVGILFPDTLIDGYP